jgi:predicted acyl esterase
MGPITVDFHVSTSGTDGDWVVKVIDQYPNGVAPNPGQDVGTGGYEMLVRADVMRGKFRNSFEHPEAFVPGKVTHLKFNLPDVCHTFKPGHRILVEVQSSWFPLVDRNPQTFCDIRKARESDFKPAQIHIYRSARYPSELVFGTH